MREGTEDRELAETGVVEQLPRSDDDEGQAGWRVAPTGQPPRARDNVGREEGQ